MLKLEVVCSLSCRVAARTGTNWWEVLTVAVTLKLAPHQQCRELGCRHCYYLGEDLEHPGYLLKSECAKNLVNYVLAVIKGGSLVIKRQDTPCDMKPPIHTSHL